MKNIKLFMVACITMLSIEAFPQNVGISDTQITPNGSAILELRSTDKGFLPPRMTTTERNAIINPAQGLVVYNTTDSCLNTYDGVAWSGCLGQQSSIAEEVQKPWIIPTRHFIDNTYRACENIFTDKQVLISCRYVGVNTGGAIDLSKMVVQLPDYRLQERKYFNDWFGAYITSAVVLDSSLYVLMTDYNNPGPLFNYRIYRYNLYNINQGAIQIAIIGQPLIPVALSAPYNMILTSNGTNFYLNYNGTHSSSDYVIARYIPFGNTLQYQNSIVCGNTTYSFNRFLVDAQENFYGIGYNPSVGNLGLRKFNSLGALQYSDENYLFSTGYSAFLKWNEAYYYDNQGEYFIRLWLE